jgi:hypothetical protein
MAVVSGHVGIELKPITLVLRTGYCTGTLVTFPILEHTSYPDDGGSTFLRNAVTKEQEGSSKLMSLSSLIDKHSTLMMEAVFLRNVSKLWHCNM